MFVLVICVLEFWVFSICLFWLLAGYLFSFSDCLGVLSAWCFDLSFAYLDWLRWLFVY